MKNVIYQDEVVTAHIPERPASVGHIRIFPNKEYKTLQDIPTEDYTHIWYVASYAATLLFEGLHAHGTNIIMNEMENKFSVDVLARFENDGLDFSFEPLRVDETSLGDTATKIKDKADLIGHAKPKKEVVDLDAKDEIKQDGEKENYILKSLERLP